MRRNQWLIDLSNDSEFWCVDDISTDEQMWPSMITIQYDELHKMAIDGNVYGCLLMIKDIYETLMKIPVIMAAIVLKNIADKDCVEYRNFVGNLFEGPLSMGSWSDTGRFIYKKGKKCSRKFPDSLKNILEETVALYDKDVSDTVRDVVNWRNSSIGHGLLKFQDDLDYQTELRNLIKNLYDFFMLHTVSDSYKKAVFYIGEKPLVGREMINLDSAKELALKVEDKSYEISPYIIKKEISLAFFDSYYSRKKKIKFADYYNGKIYIEGEDRFQTIIRRYLKNTLSEDSVNSAFVSREVEMIMSCLKAPDKYVRPKFLINDLKSILDDIEKGVILIQMDRGIGKTALSYQMNGLYNDKPLIPRSFTRTYHIADLQNRGIYDFVSSFNTSFKRSSKPQFDIRESGIQSVDIRLGSDNPAMEMANALSRYHRYYRERYTILVLDGIDELPMSGGELFDFIPDKDMMDEGTFIIITSRFANDTTTTGQSRVHIQKAVEKADWVYSVHRTDEENVNLLKEYIKIKDPQLTEEKKEDIIEKADYRFLFLKALLPVKDNVQINDFNEEELIKAYIDYLFTAYSKPQKEETKRLLMAIASFDSISLREYKDYLGVGEISYRLIGSLNDIIPLLTVVHKDGENYYEFADFEYKKYILNAFRDTLLSLIKDFQISFQQNLGNYSYSTRENMDGSKVKELNQLLVFFLGGYSSLWGHLKTLGGDAIEQFGNDTGFIHLAYVIGSLMNLDRWFFSGNENVGGVYLSALLEGVMANGRLWDITVAPDDCFYHYIYRAGNYFSIRRDILNTVKNGGFDSVFLPILFCNDLEYKEKDEYWELIAPFAETNKIDVVIDYIFWKANRLYIKDYLEVILEHKIDRSNREKILNMLAYINHDNMHEEVAETAMHYFKMLLSEGLAIKNPTGEEYDKKVLEAIKAGNVDLLREATYQKQFYRVKSILEEKRAYDKDELRELAYYIAYSIQNDSDRALLIKLNETMVFLYKKQKNYKALADVFEEIFLISNSFNLFLKKLLNDEDKSFVDMASRWLTYIYESELKEYFVVRKTGGELFEALYPKIDSFHPGNKMKLIEWFLEHDGVWYYFHRYSYEPIFPSEILEHYYFPAPYTLELLWEYMKNGFVDRQQSFIKKIETGIIYYLNDKRFLDNPNAYRTIDLYLRNKYKHIGIFVMWIKEHNLQGGLKCLDALEKKIADIEQLIQDTIAGETIEGFDANNIFYWLNIITDHYHIQKEYGYAVDILQKIQEKIASVIQIQSDETILTSLSSIQIEVGNYKCFFKYLLNGDVDELSRYVHQLAQAEKEKISYYSYFTGHDNMVYRLFEDVLNNSVKSPKDYEMCVICGQ